VWRGVSKFGGFARLVSGVRFPSEFIQFTGPRVLIDLLILDPRVVFAEPITKNRPIVLIQILYLFFDRLNPGGQHSGPTFTSKLFQPTVRPYPLA